MHTQWSDIHEIVIGPSVYKGTKFKCIISLNFKIVKPYLHIAGLKIASLFTLFCCSTLHNVIGFDARKFSL